MKWNARRFIDVLFVKQREAYCRVRWQFCLHFGMKNTRIANSRTWWDWVTFRYECGENNYSLNYIHFLFCFVFVKSCLWLHGKDRGSTYLLIAGWRPLCCRFSVVSRLRQACWFAQGTWQCFCVSAGPRVRYRHVELLMTQISTSSC